MFRGSDGSAKHDKNYHVFIERFQPLAQKIDQLIKK